MLGQIFLTGAQLGDLAGFLVGKFGTAPGCGNQKEFWLENVNVRRLVKQMEMWSGDPKEDVT